MGVRSNDHQKVAGKQYFENEVQFKGSIYHHNDLPGIIKPIFTSVTALSADAALSANTLYHVTDTNANTSTLPAAADSKVGDIIQLKYIAIVGDGTVHKFGTSGEFYSATSCIFKSTNSANGVVFAHDVADGTGDDFLNLTGATNAGIGIGTELLFVFNGTQWHVEGTVVGTGTGAAASVTAAFAAS